MTVPYRTQSGLQIGRTFTKATRVADMNADELAIQRALLPVPEHRIEAHEWVLYVIAGLVMGWFAWDWLMRTAGA